MTTKVFATLKGHDATLTYDSVKTIVADNKALDSDKTRALGRVCNGGDIVSVIFADDQSKVIATATIKSEKWNVIYADKSHKSAVIDRTDTRRTGKKEYKTLPISQVRDMGPDVELIARAVLSELSIIDKKSKSEVSALKTAISEKDAEIARLLQAVEELKKLQSA